MIEVAKMRPAAVREIQTGQFIFPCNDDNEIFVGGLTGDHEVSICLHGPEPFQVDLRPHWMRAPGMTIEGIRVEADHLSAYRLRDEREAKGDLISDTGSQGIVGKSGHDLFTVWYEGEPHDPSMTAIGFKAWQIVSGPVDKPLILFSHSRE